MQVVRQSKRYSSQTNSLQPPGFLDPSDKTVTLAKAISVENAPSIYTHSIPSAIPADLFYCSFCAFHAIPVEMGR
jgi:hypothetical protein